MIGIVRTKGVILKGNDETKESGRSDFFDILKRSSAVGILEKPPFSGSWIDRSIIGDRILDAGENIYLRVEIIGGPDGSPTLFRIIPHEYQAVEEEIRILCDCISDPKGLCPPQSVLEDEIRLRRFTEKGYRRLISAMVDSDGKVNVPRLSHICAQYTTGYGAVEHLLRDERVQDIYIDSPTEENPVYVSVGNTTDPTLEGTYPTNLYLTPEELKRIVSVLSYHSDRPFSEANPVLECDMPIFRTRVTIVGPPLSPGGISIAFRKHSHDPWTMMRLISTGSIDPKAAAFLNLSLDGRSTLLVAGPRGAGKTSLLGALLFDVERSQRTIVIEDTPELPVEQLQEHGYKVMSLLIGEGSSSAEGALRTALRLGESVIVMGEVRGPETKVLYEAMSAGTAGSSVMGTFHADSARSVYKRVVDDMGVPPGSFSATDLVVVCGLVRPQGRRLRLRRVVQIAEVVKDGEKGEFRDLFVYDHRKGSLVPADGWERSETISRIALTWGWEASDVYDEVRSRASVYRKAMSMLTDEILRKPQTEAAVFEAYRSVREKAVEKGWIGDGKRLLKSWKKRFEKVVL